MGNGIESNEPFLRGNKIMNIEINREGHYGCQTSCMIPMQICWAAAETSILTDFVPNGNGTEE